MNMKKFLAKVIFFTCIPFLFSFTKEDVNILTLENGLTLYYLQDTSTATVRIEVNIKAGTVYQTPENAGFFSLYARLAGLEITPDCVKAQKTVSPWQVEKTVEEYAKLLLPLEISEQTLQKEFNKSKDEIKEFTDSTAGFINASIDSRVFNQTPWKQESGIYPSLFNSNSLPQVRTILSQIQKNFYTPGKTSIYISGNITPSTALTLINKYFGKFPSSYLSQEPDFLQNFNKKSDNDVTKFVITDDELSTDLTQIVLQYTDFTQDEADIIAAVFNRGNSEFKKLLLKQKNLAIRAADYIDASSAQQINSSRLIIQSICEKTKVSPATQAELFLAMSKEKNRINEKELESVLKSFDSNYTEVTDNSTLLMKNLAVFNQINKNPEETLFSRTESFGELSAQYLNSKYENSIPYVFVLCNTALYNKHVKEFSKSGYTRITVKNGPWYKQSKYKPFIAKKNLIKTETANTDMMISAKRFIEENKSQFSSLTLKNNIGVSLKNNPNSKTAVISLAIDGGELMFAENDSGMAGVLVNSLAHIIQQQLDNKFRQGDLKSFPTVTSWVTTQYSLLNINCQNQDIEKCIKIASDCIIFGDIAPTLADGISYELRSQWKIKTGSPDFQLLCEAVRNIYKKPFTNLYDDSKDKPAQMDFTDIAASYPKILDCTRFSLVIIGGISDINSLTQTLESTFGVLSTNKTSQNLQTKVEKITLPQKAKRIQLRHLFFTDISADKAGPRPAILIPTTDFSDPLLYLLEGPDISSLDNALFTALLYLTGQRLQEKVSSEQTVKVTAPDAQLPYGQIIVTKIKHTNQTDSIYEEAVKEIIDELKTVIQDNDSNISNLEKDSILTELENLWVIRELEKTSTNEGTATLIQNGRINGNPTLYLDMYDAVNKATAEDYYIIAKSYLLSIPSLRIYSADSKK